MLYRDIPYLAFLVISENSEFSTDFSTFSYPEKIILDKYVNN